MKKIEILGTGCAKCRTLEQNTREAATQLGIDAEIIKVTAMEEIIARGVMMTPALAIDGEVRASGKTLSVADVASLLTSNPATPATPGEA